MSEMSVRLDLPYLQPAQAQKHITHNEALERLDLLVQLTVQAFGAQTPPAQPQEGEIWALGPSPTDGWAGQPDMLAAWSGQGWIFVAPQPGWRAAMEGDLRVWTGSDWARPPLQDPQDLAGLGVNTGFDTTNRLSVAAPATLFSHEGTDHRLKINKAGTGDTASLLFQTGWSARAELGTPGSDDFVVKVSPDGTGWVDALGFEATTGRPFGAALMQSPADPAEGRFPVLRAQGGVFGLGAQTPVQSADWDSIARVGVYTNGTTDSESAGGPSGTSFMHMCLLHMQGGTIGSRAQLAFRTSTSNPEIYFRAADGGAYSTWRRLDPEYGTGPNGSYVRFADGTQICWRIVENFDFTGNYTNNPAAPLPANFVDSRNPASFGPNTSNSDYSFNTAVENLDALGKLAGYADQDDFRLVFGGVSGADPAGSFFAWAIGRWF